jgi:hypothetical protein
VLREPRWRPADRPAPLPHLVVVPDDEDPEDPSWLVTLVLLVSVVLLLASWVLYGPRLT